MVDTVRTIDAFLNASTGILRDGQAAGSITPQDIRDALITLQSMCGNVATPEMYGAVGDGVTNDTTAFNNCLAANLVMVVPPKKYAVGNVTVNTGNIIKGVFAPILYDGASVIASPVRPQLVAVSGATDIFNVGGCTRYAIMNMILNGNNNGAHGISDNSNAASMGYGLLENLTILNCDVGLGGGARGGQAVNQGRILHCEFGANDIGMRNPNDCQLVNCDFSANVTTGLYIGNGLGATSVSSTRFEWNGGSGCDMNGCNDICIDGCWTDSNNGPAFIMRGGAKGIAITGGSHRFNGQTNTAANRSHIYINTATHITITGMAARQATSSPIPLYFCEFAGTNSVISIVGNLGTGGNTGTNPSTYRAVGNTSITDV